jgi:hypothetical protein
MTETKGKGLRVPNALDHRAAQNVNSQSPKDLIGSNLLSELAIQIARNPL